MVCVFKVFTDTWQKHHHPQNQKERLAVVSGHDKLHEHIYTQGVIGDEIGHKPLEATFLFN